MELGPCAGYRGTDGTELGGAHPTPPATGTYPLGSKLIRRLRTGGTKNLIME